MRSALLGYGLLVLILLVFQRKMIYHPQQADRLDANQATSLTEVHDFTYQGADGETLHGWHYARALSESHPEDLSDSPRVILYFPGNAGNRAGRVERCEMFASLGCDVLIVDYRGFGENPGSPTEETLVSDALSLWKHVTEEMHVPHNRVVLFGESLGGGVATQLAAKQSRNGTPPEGLIIQSSFNCLGDVAYNHYPIFPTSLLLFDQFDSESHIGDITCRYLHIHGDSDKVVPYSCGQKLFDAAPDDIDKKFVTLENAGHNDIYSNPRNFVPFARAVSDWLQHAQTSASGKK